MRGNCKISHARLKPSSAAWILELIGNDSELAGYKRITAELGHLFAYLPERSRFNRRRRNLCHASETLRCALRKCLPDAEVFIVDSFPIRVCDFKRGRASTSPLKCADATGTLATYGKCATKSLGTFFGFRGSLITTVYGLPVDFAIATADTDDREVWFLCSVNGAGIRSFSQTKGTSRRYFKQIYFTTTMFVF